MTSAAATPSRTLWVSKARRCFTGICTMNPQLRPNCTVIYMKDGKAQVYAVQEINPGEELCISYIDVDQDLEERQSCLREYQFECHCAPL
ncbi:hypothetical protein PINS_up020977 [Pythium insidiosum]|nr:hypothetical protein PINS_up020977 [Pythium insidiosum]